VDIMVWALLMIACQQDEVEEVLALEPSLTNGGAVYDMSCASCHGGEGEGGIGTSFVQAFNELHDQGGSWEAELRAWVLTILDGEGTMPAWRGELSEQEVADVVGYVHTTWGM
jgi:mono/diheme cytochrome c family protein